MCNTYKERNMLVKNNTCQMISRFKNTFGTYFQNWAKVFWFDKTVSLIPDWGLNQDLLV